MNVVPVQFVLDLFGPGRIDAAVWGILPANVLIGSSFPVRDAMIPTGRGFAPQKGHVEFVLNGLDQFPTLTFVGRKVIITPPPTSIQHHMGWAWIQQRHVIP